MRIIKWLFKYGVLIAYILLTLVLIVEASLPGDISATQSNAVGDVITDITGNEFEEKPVVIDPESLDLTIKESTKYLVGEIYQLNPVILPANATNKAVTYSSSDESIASVSNDGKIKLHKKGEVTITSKIKDTQISDSITIIVEEELLTDFLISLQETLYLGEEYNIKVTPIPSLATNKEFTFESSNESIATISSSGHIVPLSIGSVTFRVKHSSNIVKEITVNVEELIITKIPVTGLNVKEETINMIELDSYKLIVDVLPNDATNKELKFESSDNRVLTIDYNGVITAHKHGYATIKITSLSDTTIYKTISVHVSSKIVDIYIEDENIKLYVNESTKLNIIERTLPVEYSIEFISKDNNICEVHEDGTLKAISKGKTTVEVIYTAGDGTTKTLEVVIEVDKKIDFSALNEFYFNVRKGIGHFGAFFVLAIFASFVVIMFFKRKLIFSMVSLITGFIIAGLTELIQTYVPGRSGLFQDVKIDYAGYLLGSILVLGIYFIIYIFKGRKKVETN